MNDWDGLRPKNVVQTAVADIDRRKRNEVRGAGDSVKSIEVCRRYGADYEHYGFMRHHVKAADGPFGLIQIALDATLKADEAFMAKLHKTTKPYMKHLYSPKILRAALALEKANEPKAATSDSTAPD